MHKTHCGGRGGHWKTGTPWYLLVEPEDRAVLFPEKVPGLWVDHHGLPVCEKIFYCLSHSGQASVFPERYPSGQKKGKSSMTLKGLAPEKADWAENPENLSSIPGTVGWRENGFLWVAMETPHECPSPGNKYMH